MIQYTTFGQNPSFGSGLIGADKLFDIQSAGYDLEKKVKVICFFPMSQWCFCVSLVKINLLVQAIECRQGSFLQSLVCGDLEI